MQTTDRATAAYLGLAIGDALGATVEFMLPREIAAKYGVHNTLRGGGWLHLKPGQVTDDTTMSLALGNSILAQGRVDAFAAALSFDTWMRAKPVDIGNTVRRNLLHFRKTGNPEAPYSDQDAGNGAAMRILPVAIATFDETEEIVRSACRAQAHVTHNCIASDAACETLAFMVQDAIRGKDKYYLLHKHAHSLAAQFPEFKFRAIKQSSNPSGYVAHTLQAVFQSFFDTDDFSACLIDVVNRGGDADTTGAIAGMLAGAVYGLAGIPGIWVKKLDLEIRHSCTTQAKALMELAAQKSAVAAIKPGPMQQTALSPEPLQVPCLHRILSKSFCMCLKCQDLIQQWPQLYFLLIAVPEGIVSRYCLLYSSIAFLMALTWGLSVSTFFCAGGGTGFFFSFAFGAKAAAAGFFGALAGSGTEAACNLSATTGAADAATGAETALAAGKAAAFALATARNCSSSVGDIFSFDCRCVTFLMILASSSSDFLRSSPCWDFSRVMLNLRLSSSDFVAIRLAFRFSMPELSLSNCARSE